MRRFLAAAIALAVFSLQPSALAQTTPPPSMTVDAVAVGVGGAIVVTGVVDGDAAPSTRSITFPSWETAASETREFCRRLLLVALSKPGQYKVKAGPSLCVVELVTP